MVTYLLLSSGLLLPDHLSVVSSAVALIPDLAATTSFCLIPLSENPNQRDFIWIFKSNVLGTTMQLEAAAAWTIALKRKVVFLFKFVMSGL